MERVSVLLLLLLCSLSGAELQDNEIIEQRKVSPESVNVPEPQPCPSDLHAVLREMSAKLAENRLMIQQLQTLNQEQSVKLKEVDTLKLQLQEQAAKLNEIEKHASEVDTLKLQQQGQAAELNSIKARTNVTENHVESLRRDKAVGQVAFSAGLVTSGSLTLGPFNTRTPVVFRHVVSNIGNAYNPNTGFFIAPVRGAYHFEFYIIGPMDSSPITSGAMLVKNGGRVFASYERQANGWGSSSNGATLLLEAGDVVFVHLWENTRIFDDGYHYSSFSGHLLFPM